MSISYNGNNYTTKTSYRNIYISKYTPHSTPRKKTLETHDYMVISDLTYWKKCIHAFLKGINIKYIQTTSVGIWTMFCKSIFYAFNC